MKKTTPPSDSSMIPRGELILVHASVLTPATSHAITSMLARVGSRLQLARTSRHITMPSLSKLTGISRSSLYAAEAGKVDLRLSDLLQLAKALEVPASWLVKAV